MELSLFGLFVFYLWNGLSESEVYFRTLSNIYMKLFLGKQLTLKTINTFGKKRHHRCLRL